eukprot:TRINITY_DN95673_c0_g1_i1.p1 TRINITY_DN95673_c0_g1~~TRINITY_DN95673_c0_g1_i1.p1  ORF type:complete len:632 (+),score=147.91 TRINITY_DN95673_c0_g1_i1:26-1897(+)
MPPKKPPPAPAAQTTAPASPPVAAKAKPKAVKPKSKAKAKAKSEAAADSDLPRKLSKSSRSRDPDADYGSGSSAGYTDGLTGYCLPLTHRRYGIAITWDPLSPKDPVDLDLQAVIVDKRGHIVDAVYYNNLMAMKGAVQHSGDETTGDAEEFDEMIWTTFPKLPEEVRMLLFIVAASGDNSLRDATNAEIHILQDSYGQTVNRWKVERSSADVDVVAMMEKNSSGKWRLYQVDEPAERGDHFLDILEPTIGDIIRRRIDKAPKYQRVAFQMTKGALVDLPKDALKRLRFSVEANVKRSVKKQIDLDVSAVFTDKTGKSLGGCDCENLKLFGCEHSGDDEADEDLNLDLLQVPAKVHQIFIVVDLYSSSNVTFNDMTDASCKVSDQNCKNLACFSLQSETASDENGLILCRLLKGSSKRWELQAVGRFCSGPTWKEALPTIQKLYAEEEEARKLAAHVGRNRKKTRKLVWRGNPAAAAEPETKVEAGASFIEQIFSDQENDNEDEPEKPLESVEAVKARRQTPAAEEPEAFERRKVKRLTKTKRTMDTQGLQAELIKKIAAGTEEVEEPSNLESSAVENGRETFILEDKRTYNSEGDPDMKKETGCSWNLLASLGFVWQPCLKT